MMRALMPILRLLGGHRATLWLIGLSAAVVSGGLAGVLDIATWAWAPGAGLLVNLAAALVAYPSLRTQPWLFAFHALAGVLLIAAMADQLTAFKGRLEITEGQDFAPALVEYEAGPLHPFALDEIAFVQGGFTIRYAPGMKRRETESTVLLPDGAGGWTQRVVGDESPLKLAGYRFYTTHNKGFAPVVTFTDRQGRQATGAVHMPSYPLFSHRQANAWTPPGGAPVMLFLKFAEPVYDEAGDWSFARPEDPVLVVTRGGARHELRPGESVGLAEGRLAFDGLRVWMGYTVVSTGLAPWLMALSLAAGGCLALHLLTRHAPRRAARLEEARNAA